MPGPVVWLQRWRHPCNVLMSAEFSPDLPPPKEIIHVGSSRPIRVVCLAGVIALLFPADAFAYLDPGSGSLIFQTVVATLAGVAYGVRVYWGRIRGWFGKGPSNGSDKAEAPKDTQL